MVGGEFTHKLSSHSTSVCKVSESSAYFTHSTRSSLVYCEQNGSAGDVGRVVRIMLLLYNERAVEMRRCLKSRESNKRRDISVDKEPDASFDVKLHEDLNDYLKWPACVFGPCSNEQQCR